MFDDLSDSQFEWLKNITLICILLVIATVLLRGCVIPGRDAEKVEAVQKTLDWQVAPYAAILQNYSLQHAELAPVLSSMDACMREDLKGHLSLAHPRINSGEAATSFRACMLNEVINDMRSQKVDDRKLAPQIASITAPLANAMAAVKR